MTWGPALRLEIAVLFEDVAHPERDTRMERWRSWHYQRRRDRRAAERELLSFLRKSQKRWRPRPATPRPDLEAHRARMSAIARARIARGVPMPRGGRRKVA